MNQTHIKSKNTLVTLPEPVKPEMPPELARSIQNFDGLSIFRGQTPKRIVDLAKEHLARLQVYHAPPPPERMELWARKLRDGVAPISEQDLVLRIRAIEMACGHFPGWAWNSDTLKAALQVYKFFPSAAEVFEILSPVVNKGTLGLAQIRMLAQAMPAAVDN